VRWRDGSQLAFSAVRSQLLRSFLTALGIAVGVGAVVLLTALGTGLQRFTLERFSQFGTNLLTVTPGKTGTFGMTGATINSVRPLSLEDAEAVATLPHVLGVNPLVMGNVAVEFGDRSRRCQVNAVGARTPLVWNYPVALGAFLPEEDPRTARAFAVLGDKLRRELFGDQNPLGAPIRVGGVRFRVCGVMSPKDQLLGLDLDDSVFVPIARGLELFNREGLMQVNVQFADPSVADQVIAAVTRTLLARHGREDFTVKDQRQMLAVLGGVLGMLTFAVAALGGISLVVGGVGILTIMTIALQERVAEIGLLRAIGATRRQLLALFLGEAAALSLLGGLAGLGGGAGLALLLHALFPSLPAAVTPFHATIAIAVSLTIGLLAGIAPALRASRLDPIEALRAE
jgi:putative ABC transport system permease protein